MSVITPGEEVKGSTPFQGVNITPISEQRNNSLAGIKVIEKDSYILTADGLVEKPLAITCDELAAYKLES